MVEHDYLEANGKEKIQSLHYLFDQESVCISTTKGDLLLWQPELNNIECVGSVDAGFTYAQWSPDHELLVLTTGSFFFLFCKFASYVIFKGFRSKSFAFTKLKWESIRSNFIESVIIKTVRT